mgnify:CR=1 FL=1
MSQTSDHTGEEVALWDAFRKGDETAFGEIVRKYYRSLFGYGMKFSPDREFVKDCIQDLFMELWSKRDSLGDTDFVKFYLFKSLRRKIHRENMRRQRVDEDADLDFSAEQQEEPSFEQQIIESEIFQNRLKKIESELKSLPRRQQEVIFLKFFENLDNNAIAEVMSISKQAVSNLIYRTIKLLKEKI